MVVTLHAQQETLKFAIIKRQEIGYVKHANLQKTTITGECVYTGLRG